MGPLGPLPWKVMSHILKFWDNDPAHHKSEDLPIVINSLLYMGNCQNTVPSCIKVHEKYILILMWPGQVCAIFKQQVISR